MEVLKHECGVAMVRLLKPLEYYHEKYGSWMYGLNKLYLLMEKQHNRGQEGAGLACVKLEANAGEEYMFRERAVGTGAITEIFAAVHEHYKDLTYLSLESFIWATSVTVPPENPESLISILFYDAITGVQRTSPFAEIST